MGVRSVPVRQHQPHDCWPTLGRTLCACCHVGDTPSTGLGLTGSAVAKGKTESDKIAELLQRIARHANSDAEPGTKTVGRAAQREHTDTGSTV